MASCIKWLFELCWWLLLVLISKHEIFLFLRLSALITGWKPNSFFDQIASWHLQLWSTFQWLFQKPLKWRKLRGWSSSETIRCKAVSYSQTDTVQKDKYSVLRLMLSTKAKMFPSKCFVHDLHRSLQLHLYFLVLNWKHNKLLTKAMSSFYLVLGRKVYVSIPVWYCLWNIFSQP